MCKKEDCPIYDTCDKEHEQALYCRKVELLIHLSKLGKLKPKKMFVHSLPVVPAFVS